MDTARLSSSMATVGTNKQTNKQQTNKQTDNKQTNKINRSNKQTNKQTNKHRPPLGGYHLVARPNVELEPLLALSALPQWAQPPLSSGPDQPGGSLTCCVLSLGRTYISVQMAR
jgi:hypothetical protein